MSRLNELIAELCPDGVEYKALGEIGSFYGGLTGKTKKDFGSGAKFVTYNNVYGNPSVNLEEYGLVSLNPGERQNTVELGDVLFTISSENREEAGLTSVMTEDPGEPWYLNSFCTGWRLHDTSLLLPDYLKHLLRGPELRKAISRTANGVTRFNISKPKLAKVRIPVPPIEVQYEVVRLLDEYTAAHDELVSLLMKESQSYQDAYDCVNNYMFDTCVQDESAKHYTLGDVVRFINGRAYKQEELLDAGKYRVLRVGNFFTSDSWYYSNLELPAEKYCDTGDLLYAWAASFGPKIWEGGKTIFHYHIWNVKFDEQTIDKEFLYYFLAYDARVIRESNSVTRSTMMHVSMASMKKRPIVVPDVSIQRELVAVLKRTEGNYRHLQKSIDDELQLLSEQLTLVRNQLLSFPEKVV